MAGSLSDDLFIGSIISLLIWGCTSGIFTRFNLTHTEDRYIQPPDAEEYFSPKPDKNLSCTLSVPSILLRPYSVLPPPLSFRTLNFNPSQLLFSLHARFRC